MEYELNGERHTLKQWAALLGVNYKTLWYRLKNGMSIERAFTSKLERAPHKRDLERTMDKTCLHCSASFVIPKCHDWREHCCSTACKTAHRKEKSLALAASRTRLCRGCETSFVAKSSQLAEGAGNYCSNECHRRHFGISHIHTPEARAKAAAARKASMLAGKWQPLRGEKAWRWKGGHEAHLKRRRESGALRASTRKYRRENPEKVREFTQRRKGRKLGRLPRGTIQKIGTLQRWKCAICRVNVKDGYHVDHIMPLALGGEHVAANIQLLCPSCNVRKSAKHPVAFMQERGFLL